MRLIYGQDQLSQREQNQIAELDVAIAAWIGIRPDTTAPPGFDSE